MHEIGLCEALIAALEQRAGDRPVAGLGVRSGLLNHVDQEAMQQSFTLVAQGRPCAGARLDLEIVPGRLHCRACGRDAQVLELFAACPSCGSPDVELNAGDELILKWIEYADAEPAKREGTMRP